MDWGPPDGLAAAEDHHVGAVLDEAAQVLHRREHGGGIHDEGQAVAVGDVGHLIQAGEGVPHPAGGNEGQGGCLVVDGGLDLPGVGAVGVAHPDYPGTGLAPVLDVADAVVPLEDDLVAQALGVW